MAPSAGIEPTTTRLTIGRSTIELRRNGLLGRTRTANPALRTRSLYPLSYEEKWISHKDSNLDLLGQNQTPYQLGHGRKWSPYEESNPGHLITKQALYHLSFRGLARVEGLEPSTHSFGGHCSTTELHSHMV